MSNLANDMGQTPLLILKPDCFSVVQCWGGAARSPKRSSGTKSQDKAIVREENGNTGASVKLVTVTQGAL